MILNICNPVSSDWGGGPYPPQALSTWSYTYTDVGLVDPRRSGSCRSGW